MRKTGQRNLSATIRCRSGLRIGGSDEQLQIGGADLTCIKHPETLEPYIPGTSIKGKMRSELEKKLGKFGGQNQTEPCGCGKPDCLICRVFGPHKNTQHRLGPTRIIVRDAPPKGHPALETKYENVINRMTGTAEHPRRVERVAAGAEFDLRIAVQIWDLDAEISYAGARGGDALVEFIKEGLRSLCETGLGSGVSKGSGEIELVDVKLDGQQIDLDSRPAA